MTTILLGAAAGFIIGVVVALVVGHRWLTSADPQPIDDLDDDDEDDLVAEVRDALNGKVEQAAADRIADAQKLVNVMENAANVLLNAARTERSAADALVAATEQSKRLEEAVVLLRNVCESIDAQQGAILTSLINSGLMQRADLDRSRLRQVGEFDEENPPPLAEQVRHNPLDAVLK